jgi:hypothetical protein
LRTGLRAEPGQRDLHGGNLVDRRVVEPGVLAQRQANVFAHIERAEQAAVLEHHTEARTQALGFGFVQPQQVDAEDADRARVGAVQQDHLAQQRGLARAAAAHQGEDLAALDLELDVLVHHVLAEARGEVADLDDRVGGGHVRGRGS